MEFIVNKPPFACMRKISFVIIVLLISVSADAANYYVRTDGNDSCNGTTDAAGSSGNCAKRTIQAGINLASSAGDTVEVHTGSYAESIHSSYAGTSAYPITIEGYTGETVTTTKIAINHDYNIFNNFHTTSSAAASYVNGGANVDIDGNHDTASNIYATTDYGPPSEGNRAAFHIAGSYAEIYGSTVDGQNNSHTNTYSHAIYAGSSTSNISFHNNTIKNDFCPGRLVELYGHDHHIYDNEIYGTASGGTDCPSTGSGAIHVDIFQIFKSPSYDNIVERNYIHDMDAQWVMFADDPGEGGYEGIIHNWTFRDNVYANIPHSGFIKSPYIKYYSNTFYNVGAGAGSNFLTYATDSEGWGYGGEFINNVVITTADQGIQQDSTTIQNNYFGTPAFGTFNRPAGTAYINGGDPDFVAYNTNCISNSCNFDIGANSVLIGQGQNLSSKGFSVDYNQDAWGTIWDIGAYKYGSGSGTNHPWVSTTGTASWANCQSATALSGTAACSLATANSNASADDVIQMRSGVYSTAIAPTNSGTSGHPITYQAYSGDAQWSVKITTTSTTTPAADLSQSYIKLSGLYFYNTGYRWVELTGDYNTIDGCRFYAAQTGTGIHTGPTNYNRITNNIFDDAPLKANTIIVPEASSCTAANTPYTGCTADGGWDQDCQDEYDAGLSLNADCDAYTAPSNDVYSYSSTGLVVEGNTFGTVSHNELTIDSQYAQYNNVIRNNIFNNVYHTDVGPGGDYCLFENNTVLNAGSQSDKNLTYRDRLTVNGAGIYGEVSHGIIRNNIVKNNDYGYFGSYKSSTHFPSSYSHVYNNTFYNNSTGIASSNNNVDGTNLDSNIFKDNVFFESGITSGLVGASCFTSDGISQVDYCAFSGTNNNYHFYNAWTSGGDFYYKSTSAPVRTLSQMESAYPSEWANNSDVTNPYWVDSANNDFNLQSSSPLINAGDFLTTITSASGSGTTFTVGDANYFYDGWSIPGEVGDTIYTSSGQSATITSINYSTGQITVGGSVSWTQGDGVTTVNYSGSAPDIGAYEYTGAGDTTDPTVSITSPTSNATYDNGSTATIDLGGSSSDDTGVTSVTWSNDRGGSGTTTGTTSWSISGISLSSGDNVITVTAHDAASNTGTDQITVTYTPPAGSGGWSTGWISGQK
jgi:Bacterial Ig domain